MIPKTISSALLTIVLVGCSSTPPQKPEPQRLAFSAVADSLIYVGLRETQWGIEVWDQGRNQQLWSHNAERHLVPASNIKLVVTIVALGALGPDWRYQTPVLVAGAPGDSAPRALIIKGTGDPTWSSRFYQSDYTVLEAIADSLLAHGIRRIAGPLIVDATAFAGEQVHSAWEIGDLPWYYAAPTGALAFAEGDARLITTAANDGVTVRTEFDWPHTVLNQVRIDTVGAPTNVDIAYEGWPQPLAVNGSLAPGRADTSRIALPDQAAFAARALKAVLERKGLEVTDGIAIWRDTTELAGLPPARTVFTWSSPPLIEIAAAILKPSQNWIAEQLLKTLGYVKGTRGSWSGGRAAERRYLIDAIGIDSLAFSLSDGSGLSAQNLVSPHAFVMLLEHARKAPWGKMFQESLATPGLRVVGPNVGAGTLTNRLLSLEGRLAAKTGTIANVNALSGYVRTESGRDLTFSILTNASGRSSAEVRRGIDALVQAMARERNWE